MSEKEKNESEKVSRRKFLRDAGFIVGGAALGIGGFSLTGCGNDRPCSTNNALSQAKVEYFGECICPNCDARIPHPRGVPCRMIDCPKCSMSMVRGAV